jgi:hypothetical protein
VQRLVLPVLVGSSVKPLPTCGAVLVHPEANLLNSNLHLHPASECHSLRRQPASFGVALAWRSTSVDTKPMAR